VRRALPYLILLLSAAGSFAAVWWRAQPVRVALRVLEAARSEAGLDEVLVDAELVERVRRVELVRRMSLDTGARDKLLGALAGDVGPDRQYPPAERPLRQRERATRGLRARLSGACTAERWPEGGAAWVARITSSAGPGQSPLPDEVVAEQRALRDRLSSATSVRVRCERGEVGMLMVRGPGLGLRVAEIFEPRRATGGVGIETSPFDPAMK